MLVVLVSRDGLEWLRRCLASLARQTHPRIGVLAVDNGSTDGSADLLESTLGADRVIRLLENRGFPGAAAEALQSDAASRADYILLLHDDTQLAPDAVSRLVEAAEHLDGVGVVGPKVLDADDPSVLREIGLSVDRLGYPYSPLERGEIDQGQYDRVREVFYVSSIAMLLSRRALERVGPPDERFVSQLEDLDLCWRVRVAGFRVLWTPQAIALHRGATHRGERPGTWPRVGLRYQRERASLAVILKNYRLSSLAYVLPMLAAQSTVRLAAFLASRRFSDAYQVAAAWGWNLVHLPGTLRRRVRSQSVRAVRDREVRRLMAPGWIRLGRWARTVGGAARPAREDEPDAKPVTPGVRLRRLAAAHPVVVAWILAGVLALIAYRHLAGASALSGGSLAVFPSSPAGFFREFASGLRSTGLGGTAPASPALPLLGLTSLLSVGSPSMAQKALLFALPAVAAVSAYRAVGSLGVERVAAVLAASSYALSSAVLWALSDGRLPELVFLAGVPWLAMRVARAFGPGLPARPDRWVVGTALGLAVLSSFFPGAFLAAAGLVGAAALAGPGGARRLRGLSVCGASIGGAAVLALPVTVGVLRSGGQALADPVGARSFASFLRTALGPAPGAWPVAFFLPVAAVLALVFLSSAFGRPAGRALVGAIVGAYLAWAAANGWLPEALANPVAYVGVLAVCLSALVGMGLQSVLGGISRASFGSRQLGSVAMIALVALGLLGQVYQAGRSGWAIGGPDRLLPADAIVSGSGAPAYRVLWFGGPHGGAFPAPGGLPDGTVAAGPASVRFGITGPAGASALDVGRAAQGPGYDRIAVTIHAILSGRTRHGGALLAPFGVRYIAAGSGDLPASVVAQLDRQVDLDGISAGGLWIYRDHLAAPLAGTLADPAWRRTAHGEDLTAIAELTSPDGVPLTGSHGVLRSGPEQPAGPALVFVAQQFDRAWRLRSANGTTSDPPFRAFGWGVGFDTRDASNVEVGYTGQGARTLRDWILVVLWFAALWVVRRPSRSA